MEKKLAYGDIRDLEAMDSRNFQKGVMEVTEKEMQIGEEPRKAGKKNTGRKNKQK